MPQSTKAATILRLWIIFLEYLMRQTPDLFMLLLSSGGWWKASRWCNEMFFPRGKIANNRLFKRAPSRRRQVEYLCTRQETCWTLFVLFSSLPFVKSWRDCVMFVKRELYIRFRRQIKHDRSSRNCRSVFPYVNIAKICEMFDKRRRVIREFNNGSRENEERARRSQNRSK